MKAPDKIYLPIVEEEGKKLLCAIWWDHDTSKGDKYVKETIPYIRKEALIEKISELRAIPHDNAIARDNAFVEIINIINSIK